MNKILIIILTTISLYALSNDIKYDMHKEEFINSFKKKNYSNALKNLEKMKKLKKNLPSSVLYFEGKALFESGSKAKSYKKFEKYIEKTGKTGKYYKKSLSYLIKAKKSIKELKRQKFNDARENINDYMNDMFNGIDRSGKFNLQENCKISFDLKVETNFLLKRVHKFNMNSYIKDFAISTRTNEDKERDIYFFINHESINYKTIFYKDGKKDGGFNKKSNSVHFTLKKEDKDYKFSGEKSINWLYNNLLTVSSKCHFIVYKR